MDAGECISKIIAWYKSLNQFSENIKTGHWPEILQGQYSVRWFWPEPCLTLVGCENPISMSGSYLCIPRNETVISKTELYCLPYCILSCLPVPTLIYLWEIYKFPGSVCLFCCITRSQAHECGNWDCTVKTRWSWTLCYSGVVQIARNLVHIKA